jgi:hypothetical protein
MNSNLSLSTPISPSSPYTYSAPSAKVKRTGHEIVLWCYKEDMPWCEAAFLERRVAFIAITVLVPGIYSLTAIGALCFINLILHARTRVFRKKSSAFYHDWCIGTVGIHCCLNLSFYAMNTNNNIDINIPSHYIYVIVIGIIALIPTLYGIILFIKETRKERYRKKHGKSKKQEQSINRESNISMSELNLKQRHRDRGISNPREDSTNSNSSDLSSIRIYDASTMDDSKSPSFSSTTPKLTPNLTPLSPRQRNGNEQRNRAMSDLPAVDEHEESNDIVPTNNNVDESVDPNAPDCYPGSVQHRRSTIVPGAAINAWVSGDDDADEFHYNDEYPTVTLHV